MAQPYIKQKDFSGVTRDVLVVEGIEIAPNKTVVLASDAAGGLTGVTLSSPTITNPVVSFTNGKPVKVATVAYTGTTVQAGVVAWQNPEASAIIILRAILDLTTKTTGVSTTDIGVTEVSAATASDTLLDGIDTGTAAAVFDSMNSLLDTATNAKAQKLASGKWVTMKSATGDTTGGVGVLYIEYVVI